MNRGWSVLTVGHDLVIEEKEALTTATPRGKLESLAPSERSQTRRVPYRVAPFMRNVQRRETHRGSK